MRPVAIPPNGVAVHGVDNAVAHRPRAVRPSTDDTDDEVELPEPMSEGRPSVEAAERALVRRPKIGDTMPIPTSPPPGPARKPVTDEEPAGGTGPKRRKRRGSGGGRSGGGRPDGGGAGDSSERSDAADGQIDGGGGRQGSCQALAAHASRR